MSRPQASPDLRALLAVPAAFALAGRGADSEDETDAYEPIELIHALKSHAGKLTVFSQIGEIALAPSRRVFAFLERTVLPVSAPRGGIVHPKVWVIRYETAGDPTDGRAVEQLLRVLVASRNLAFDVSGDTVVRLDETTRSGGTTLEPVGELFKGLLRRCSAEVPEDHRMRVQSLAAALQDVRFALPAGVESLKVHVLGLRPKPSPLPPDAERSLIISPFVSDRFFNEVHPVKIDWRQTIAGLAYKGQVAESGDGLTVTYRTTEPMPEPDNFTIHCWPLTVSGNRRRLTPGRPLDECFETSLENLSGFLAFELADMEGEMSHFVVPVPLAGVPECRDRELLRSLIGNAERFFRYLVALLEEASDQPSAIETIERISGGTGQDGDDEPISLPVLERLLRTMRRDPGKLAPLHPLVWPSSTTETRRVPVSTCWQSRRERHCGSVAAQARSVSDVWPTRSCGATGGRTP